MGSTLLGTSTGVAQQLGASLHWQIGLLGNVRCLYSERTRAYYQALHRHLVSRKLGHTPNFVFFVRPSFLERLLQPSVQTNELGYQRANWTQVYPKQGRHALVGIRERYYPL